MNENNNVLFSIPMVLFICDICPERQCGPRELFSLRLGTHSSRVHMCSCCRRISGLADSEEVVNTLLRVRTCTKKETPQQLIRTSARFRPHIFTGPIACRRVATVAMSSMLGVVRKQLKSHPAVSPSQPVLWCGAVTLEAAERTRCGEAARSGPRPPRTSP